MPTARTDDPLVFTKKSTRFHGRGGNDAACATAR
jgi:hypothetical protein